MEFIALRVGRRGRTLSYCIPDLGAVRLGNKHVKVDDGGDEGMMELDRCRRTSSAA